MHLYITVCILLAFFILPAHTSAQEDNGPGPEGPLRMFVSVKPAKASVGQEIELTMKIQIALFWHIYIEVPEGSPFIKTTFDLELPAGIEPVGDWIKPKPEPYFKGFKAGIYTGEVLIKRRLKIKQVSGTVSIGAIINYQACDPEICYPPTTKKMSATLLVK